VLAARELATLALAQMALRRGIEIEINWVGRIAVWPVMSGIFFALVVDTPLSLVLFLIGLALAILATVLYVRVALVRLRRAVSTP
jgi:phosphatidylglycerophosphate synthase